MIHRLQLTNFSAFQELDILFSKGINVVIGTNGTGKTQLLKAAYSLCSSVPPVPLRVASPNVIPAWATHRMVDIFRPLDDRLGALLHNGASTDARLRGEFTFDRNVTFSFDENSLELKLENNLEYERYSWQSVFVPSKEVLSFMKGFVNLSNKYELSFDATYRDLCSLLDAPPLKPEHIRTEAKAALESIESIVGGKFIYKGGGDVLFMTHKTTYGINVTPEGYRKLGMLYRLIETGAVVPSATGPLFWDEPESNLNPSLMKKLVGILLELARNGQQIILATHEYVLLKWLDLLTDNAEKNLVRYHVLYGDQDSGEIKLESADNFNELRHNAIADTFSDLTKEHVSRSMGDLGK